MLPAPAQAADDVFGDTVSDGAPGPGAANIEVPAAQAAQCEAELSRLDGQHRPELWWSAVERWYGLRGAYLTARPLGRRRWVSLQAGRGDG